MRGVGSVVQGTQHVVRRSVHGLELGPADAAADLNGDLDAAIGAGTRA